MPVPRPDEVQPDGEAERLREVHAGVVEARPATLADLHRQRYAPMVRLATLLIGSQAMAEEIVQDCFVRIYARFDGLEQPAAYLRQSVVNASRSAGRRITLERDRAHLERPGVAQLDADEMLDALDRLPERQRAALVLRFYQDMSEQEIAAALGCRPGTVKSLVHRGLARLREVLDQ